MAAGERNVFVMELTRPRAQQMLREIAADSSRVFVTDHAGKRMRQRRITRVQVLRCLRHGRIIEGPARSTKGNWAMTLEVASAGDILVVAAALDRDKAGNLVVVITAYTR